MKKLKIILMLSLLFSFPLQQQAEHKMQKLSSAKAGWAPGLLFSMTATTGL